MNKFGKIVLACILAVILTVIMVKTAAFKNIISFISSETETSEKDFSNLWYFSQLTEREKYIYLKLATAVENNDKKVVAVGEGNLSASDASRALEAYLLDNPECFYINNKYQIGVAKFLNVSRIKIQLEFTQNIKKIEDNKKALDAAADGVISSVISPGMTNYEKAVKLHDYLIQNVKYYDYENIEDIPFEKHTAYGALVGREAVCDGISKAYSILLKKCGIQSAVVVGRMADHHAWNKVKIDNYWYNIDVTSDACGKERTVSHVYFSLSDEDILKSHVFDLTFSTPECNNSLDYYSYNNYEITNQDILSDKISKIVSNTKGDVLEFRITNTTYTIQDVVQKLYDMDFNSYKTNKIKEMSYYYIDNVFIIPKNK